MYSLKQKISSSSSSNSLVKHETYKGGRDNYFEQVRGNCYIMPPYMIIVYLSVKRSFVHSTRENLNTIIYKDIHENVISIHCTYIYTISTWSMDRVTHCTFSIFSNKINVAFKLVILNMRFFSHCTSFLNSVISSLSLKFLIFF